MNASARRDAALMGLESEMRDLIEKLYDMSDDLKRGQIREWHFDLLSELIANERRVLSEMRDAVRRLGEAPTND